MSAKAVPGSSTVPATAWSASHGCVSSPIRPVTTRPPAPARSTVARRNGMADRGQARRAQIAALRPVLQPVPTPLERIRRQLHLTARAGVHREPVDPVAPHIRLGSRGQEPVEPAVVTSRGGQRRPVAPAVLGVVEDLLNRRDQHRMRADLDEHAVPAAGRGPRPPARSSPSRAGSGTSTARRARVAVGQPVVADRGQEADIRHARRDRAEVGEQPLAQTARCAANATRSPPAGCGSAVSARLADVLERLQGLDVAGDHGRPRPVHRRDRQLSAPRPDQLPDFGLAGARSTSCRRSPTARPEPGCAT